MAEKQSILLSTLKELSHLEISSKAELTTLRSEKENLVAELDFALSRADSLETDLSIARRDATKAVSLLQDQLSAAQSAAAAAVEDFRMQALKMDAALEKANVEAEALSKALVQERDRLASVVQELEKERRKLPGLEEALKIKDLELSNQREQLEDMTLRLGNFRDVLEPKQKGETPLALVPPGPKHGQRDGFQHIAGKRFTGGSGSTGTLGMGLRGPHGPDMGQAQDLQVRQQPESPFPIRSRDLLTPGKVRSTPQMEAPRWLELDVDTANGTVLMLGDNRLPALSEFHPAYTVALQNLAAANHILNRCSGGAAKKWPGSS